MKKFLAVVFAVLCISCVTLPAFAEGEEVSSDIVASEIVSEETNDETASVASQEADDTSSEIVSEVAGDVSAEGTSSEEIIVNYAAGQQDIGSLNLDVLFWAICGVLVLGCIVIFVYKFIQWRNSK